MKRRGSSETRFPKVWCRSELCSRGKLPFEVSKNRSQKKSEVRTFGRSDVRAFGRSDVTGTQR